MLKLKSVESVNFYGDPIDVAISEDGEAYVAVSQITGYLGLNFDSIIERFDNDPRVNLITYKDAVIVEIKKLNGFLMLLPYDEIEAEFRDDLLRYQTECFEVLHNYWIHGVAINRRERPYDITSKFKDERAVSRTALTKACADYCKDTDRDPSDLFDRVMGMSYRVIGLEPLHEHEKLTGAQARYLAWVESIFAKVIQKFASFNEVYDDPVDEALPHVKGHLHKTGQDWIALADAVPETLY